MRIGRIASCSRGEGRRDNVKLSRAPTRRIFDESDYGGE